ncbi:MlaC/ttg2D family ABC transporter substrate-binding protein [Pseudoalteromonas denitrificans]|uniref:Phospholipid transport system substrate-binding protein n=1 Tax=Pseudoalteromonas denitrificans DSM 6059 TaxID=1123010 RepID=A0A1I1R836_9GAMM|nr:ABC transporter substrate-binding protein [Pseudoalteromonas denitrificans]SFD30475.1 phospholipid transport system substrate-binding protein [Pseudoalteromonas denitrificans DSM 6059]
MLKKVIVLLILSVVMLSSGFASAQVSLDNPYKAIKQVAGNTFERLAKDQTAITKNPNHLKKVVEDELLPYIDYKYAAYKVLGSYIQKIRSIKDKDEKKAEIAKVKRFIEVFKSYLVTTYAGVFTQYTDQIVEFDPAQKVEDKKIVMVGTRIVENGKPDIHIGFKMKKNKKGQWRAYDMVAEGISLLDAKQSELHGILRKEGLEYVITLLDKKSKLPIQAKG